METQLKNLPNELINEIAEYIPLSVKEIKSFDIINDKRPYYKELYRYYYNYQYDDRYPHFRSADLIKEESEYDPYLNEWIDNDEYIVVFYH